MYGRIFVPGDEEIRWKVSRDAKQNAKKKKKSSKFVLKKPFTPKNEKPVIIYSMLMENQVTFFSLQNISGASQEKCVLRAF